MKNTSKKICIMGLLAALCMVLGYLERLVSLSFIAPGIRLGLANSVALLLVFYGKPKEALGVNLTRILLSALLFGSPVSLSFSLTGGVASWCVMSLLSKNKSVSIVGASIAAGAVHNALQLAVALLLIGQGVLYYSPLLLTAGALSGAVIGYLSRLLSKKLKTNRIF